jgi:hypothetical protein
MFGRQTSLDLFIEVYRAYPASFIGRDDLELTNSSKNYIDIYFLVILPPSALDKLSNLSRIFLLN